MRQNLKFSSAANYRWRFYGLLNGNIILKPVKGTEIDQKYLASRYIDSYVKCQPDQVRFKIFVSMQFIFVVIFLVCVCLP